jgi:hypothetical protein
MSIREESEKSRNARVASAGVRTVSLLLATSISPRTLGPTGRPIDTNRIAGVIGVPEIRFETPATAISTSAHDGQGRIHVPNLGRRQHPVVIQLE